MRTSHLIGPALLAMVLAASTSAQAQKPEENYVADSYYTFAASPTDTALMQTRREMAASAANLLAAENVYFVKNGRYTARMQELADWKPSSDIALLVTAGATWLSIRALSSVSTSWDELHVL